MENQTGRWMEPNFCFSTKEVILICQKYLYYHTLTTKARINI